MGKNREKMSNFAKVNQVSTGIRTHISNGKNFKGSFAYDGIWTRDLWVTTSNAYR